MILKKKHYFTLPRHSDFFAIQLNDFHCIFSQLTNRTKETANLHFITEVERQSEQSIRDCDRVTLI